MATMTTGSNESLDFVYDQTIIGDTTKDTDYANPDDAENVWPEGYIRINTARWVNTELGVNDPDKLIQLETFDGKKVEFHTLNFFTPEELEKQPPVVQSAPVMQAYITSPFNSVEMLDRETARYLNAMDNANKLFRDFKASYNAEEQKEFHEWKQLKEKGEAYPENTNFSEEDRRSVWEVMSGATTEDLFKFKLDVFEQEVVQNSENRDMRSKIRKAKSICEVCSYYQTILDEESPTEEEGSEE